jgi:hypothetical protein
MDDDTLPLFSLPGIRGKHLQKKQQFPMTPGLPSWVARSRQNPAWAVQGESNMQRLADFLLFSVGPRRFRLAMRGDPLAP